MEFDKLKKLAKFLNSWNLQTASLEIIKLGEENEVSYLEDLNWKSWLKSNLQDSEAAALSTPEEKMHDIEIKASKSLVKSTELIQEFEKIISKIKKQYGWNLSYMKIQITNVCMFNDNTVDYKRNPKECAGSWTKEKLIHIGDKNHLQSVMKYYGLNTSSNNLNKFIKSIIAHELMHEVYRNILSDKEKAFYKKHISSLNFTTEYLDTVTNPDSYDEESFCEYIATELTQTPRN